MFLLRQQSSSQSAVTQLLSNRIANDIEDLIARDEALVRVLYELVALLISTNLVIKPSHLSRGNLQCRQVFQGLVLSV